MSGPRSPQILLVQLSDIVDSRYFFWRRKGEEESELLARAKVFAGANGMTVRRALRGAADREAGFAAVWSLEDLTEGLGCSL